MAGVYLDHVGNGRCARTGAMAANRLIDAELDARNPRTASRAIPMGIMSRVEMLAIGAGRVRACCMWRRGN